MEKVKTDEALQKEFAQIIGEGGAELTKEQKEKIAEIAAKSGIELDVEGELSEEALGSIVGGMEPILRPTGFEVPTSTIPTSTIKPGMKQL